MSKLRKLDDVENLLIDMDGVLWRGNTPLPGLTTFFAFLREHAIRFVLVTNNASNTAQHYVKRLADYGIEVSLKEILTSAQATAEHLAQKSEPHTPVYVIGGNGLTEALTHNRFRLVDSDDHPRYVVVGWDRELTYDKLAKATLAIRAGADFVGTNPDRTWPSEQGQVPGAGATLAALQAATDVEPTVIGKPSPLMFRTAMQRMGAAYYNTAMIGDRLETDILGGQRAGVTTVLVLSGVTSDADLSDAQVRPDLVFDDIAAFVRAWKGRRAGVAS
jgi:4-nitrophenyl phosphatase